ncbi:PaaI family thioesterase [Acidovorax sp. Be4]|uniref:PaaI family thioesterase n=1 Tax=Acidovorax bellezanensis TaxID=2976702 RepID=A0ABT2PJX6_9BURK|nr:PaaI family thioesterase [Acidovorax sp. Be4]MCT9810789.1 PaaI family thioesterase [Acidovorax sp. Be4]
MNTATPENAAAQWEAQKQAVVDHMEAGGGHPGVAALTQVQGKSGLEIMQAMLAGALPYPHIAQTLDFALIEVAHGQAVFQGTPQLKHYNPMGSVHGGWFATMLDSALGCAVHTTLPAGSGYTTAELSVNIVRAASAATGPLRAIGRVVHTGRQLATAEARIVDAMGKLYAHGTTTCLVFAAKAAG